MRIKARQKGKCPFDCFCCRHSWSWLHSLLSLMSPGWPDFLVLPGFKLADFCGLVLWPVVQVWLMLLGLLCSSCCEIIPLLSSPLPCLLPCHPLPWASPTSLQNSPCLLHKECKQSSLVKDFPTIISTFPTSPSTLTTESMV